MKRIIALLLSVACILLLVGCGEKEIGEYLKNYDYKPVVVEDVVLNMYIIGGESDDNALTTVKRMINQYTELEFHSTLNVHYVSAADYDATLRSAIGSRNQADAQKSVDIALVNSESLMNYLVGADLVADLSDFYKSDDFGQLNTQIAPALLSAVNLGTTTAPAYNCVPNNRVIGEYSYIVVDKNKAFYHNFGKDVVEQMTTYESTEALRTAIGADADQYVKVVSGSYARKAELEAEGNIVNVAAVPSVTREAAYSSAFVIMKDCKNVERAMQILYALSTDTDSTLHNLLQYGVKNTNYVINEDGEVERIVSEGNRYEMDLLYTGNIYTAAYCADASLGWTKEIGTYAKKQNDAAVFAQ